MTLAIGIAFAVLVLGAGLGVLRLLGLAKGPLALGLAPAAGLALLAALGTWAVALRLPGPAGGLLLVLLAGAGFLATTRDSEVVRTALATPGEHRRAFALLGAAVGMTALVLLGGLGDLPIPLSPHDGAYHVEMIQMLRQGTWDGGWYPPGFHAGVAAFLQLLPWVDAAVGAVGASMGVSLLAPIAVFGLGCAVWKRPLFGAAGAVMVSLTFQYPYHAHFWSGWPLADALLGALGLWTLELAYLERPNVRWALLGGLVIGGLLLTHGTELYTALIGLVLLLLGRTQRVRWRAFTVHVGLGLCLALLLAAPYAASLLGFASRGGASSVGEETVQSWASRPSRGPLDQALTLGLNTATTGLLLDAPFRFALLGAGVWWTFRRHTGRMLVAVGLVFFGLALAFRQLEIPLLQRLFALTFPWAFDYRLAMVVGATAALVEGVGLAAILGLVWRYAGQGAASLSLQREGALPTPEGEGVHDRSPGSGRPGSSGREGESRRRGVGRRVASYVIVLFVAGSVWGLTQLVSASAAAYLAYSPDDAAAMAWLRTHVGPGAVVANDRFADAGIWIPYKAGVPILLPRRASSERTVEAQQILAEIGRLEPGTETANRACALGMRYVYRGAQGTAWEERHFPPLAEMRRSPGLEEVFSSGQAAIFRLRLSCG